MFYFYSKSFEGAPVTVGTTAVAITFTDPPSSISVQSDHDNTGKIWFGPSTVDNAGANAYGRLAPGESVAFDYDTLAQTLYVVSDTASQKVYKLGIIRT